MASPPKAVCIGVNERPSSIRESHRLPASCRDLASGRDCRICSAARDIRLGIRLDWYLCGTDGLEFLESCPEVATSLIALGI